MSEINREDAIAKVALAIWHYPNELYTSLNCFENCQELAERALNCLPSAEPETKLITEVKIPKEYIQSAVDEDVARIMAQPERKKGKWIDSSDVWMCSECGKWLDVLQGDADMNFCPNCGSRNIEEGEQE